MIEGIIEKAKKENKKVYVYAHKFPDGDAISSSRAVVEYLKSQGIDAQYVVTNEVRAFNQIVGNIPITTSVEKDGISIILDTSTVSYAENTLFKNSSPENTYVIDHHGKVDGAVCIEDELGLSSENVLRDSNASSVCEILVNELEQEKINPQIANMLTLGLLTDTAKLKFLKSDTLQNLSKLMELGADYEQVLGFCTRKSNLREEVGIAQTLLKTKTFPIGDTFGMILSMDNSEVDELSRTFGVRSPQKKIFKMGDIENCSFMCMLAENTPGEYNIEFRSTPIYGNFNVLQLATLHRGGGHYNASGCAIKVKDANSKARLEESLQQESSELYSSQATDLPQITLSEQDKELSQILDSRKRLTEGVNPEILARVDSLIKAGANYDYTFKTFKSFERFMLQNEILSRIPSSMYSQRQPNVDILLSQEDIDALTKKYNINEDEILSTIDSFSNINISSASITLPNGRKSTIDRNGIITADIIQTRRDNTREISK